MDGITLHRVYKVEDELIARLGRLVYGGREMNGGVLYYTFRTDAGAHCAIDFDTMHNAAMAGGAVANHLYNKLAHDLDVYDKVILGRFKLTLDDLDHVVQLAWYAVRAREAMVVVGVLNELHRRLRIPFSCALRHNSRLAIFCTERGHRLEMSYAEIEMHANCNSEQWFMQWVDDLEKRITYEQTK